MGSKSKAVKAFLAGLALQVPDSALSPLLEKDENDALVILLNTSIEGLPMGSPIRKSVDEDLYQYVGWLRAELEKRLEQSTKENSAEMVLEDDVATLLPVVNETIFRFLLASAKKDKDEETIALLKCTNFRTPDLYLRNATSMQNVLDAFKTNLFSNQNKDCVSNSELTLFVRSFLKAFKEDKEDLDEKMKIIRAFTSMIQSGSSMKNLDIGGADDLGKLIGCLTLYSILYPEQYLGNRNNFNQEEDSDSDNDVRSKKKRKKMNPSDPQFQKVQKHSKRDVNLMVSLLFAEMSGSEEMQQTAASFTIGFINSILLQDEEIFEIMSSQGKIDRRTVVREGSTILTNSIEAGNAIDRKDLPSAALLSDGNKACDLLMKWAKRTVLSAARSVEQPSYTSEDQTFLVDRAPTIDDNDGDNEEDEEMDTEKKDEEMDTEMKDEGNTSAIDNESDEQESEVESETESSALKSKVKTGTRKKAKLALPPVPENEEAKSADCGDSMVATVRRSTRARTASESDSESSIATPSRRSTRARTDPNASDSESSIITPSRRSTRARTDPNASDSESSMTTPSRRSTRTRKAPNMSDSESSMTTPSRRITRTRTASNMSDSESSMTTPSRRSTRQRKPSKKMTDA